jgi:hypothetical protein
MLFRAQIPPLSLRQIAEPYFADAHTFQCGDSQLNEFAHTANLLLWHLRNALRAIRHGHHRVDALALPGAGKTDYVTLNKFAETL